ncbi:MAG TPA: OmpA family protein [Vicinamibacteria bacterium]|nr:OmpA family protein [Vicinamibacteria bacterium]
MRRIMLPLVVLSVAASGCATKKYVSHEVGEVNQKVENLSGEVEKTQERVKTTEVRIDSVDKQSQSGIAEAKGSAAAAMNKAQDAERAAKGKLLYTVTISNDKVTFPLNRAEVSDDAKKMVDEAIAPIVAENKGVFFEIEGHTDGTGEPVYNEKLGEERAMAVRAYLHDQHNIALNRMEVISYGETKPVADNKSKDGRAQNRRVVIKVLE